MRIHGREVKHGWMVVVLVLLVIAHLAAGWLLVR
jgi:hypothetical protein